MIRAYKFSYRLMILILFISHSRQQNKQTDDEKKYELLFGTPPPPPPPPDGRTPTQQTETVSADCPGGKCVPYFQCRENGSINTDGEQLIDIRFGESPCSNYLERCCELMNIANNPIGGTSNGNSISIIPSKPNGKQECGQRHAEGVGFRITGGKEMEAHYGEFPWMIAVTEEMPSGPDAYVSGGSLIHPSVVLTAAHHFHNKNRKNTLKCRAGEWDVNSQREQFPHQDRNVKAIIIHEDFHEGSLHNDIALLLLGKSVELGDVIGTVCLPPQSYIFDGNNNCFASGWGQNAWQNTGKPQVILKKVELPIVSKEQCEQTLRSTRLGQHFLLDQSFVCAGGVMGKDTCKGDGGSPLICPIPGRIGYYYQTGIVAWGIGCGQNPGVYVNVAFFRNWIDQKFAERGFETSFYSVV